MQVRGHPGLPNRAAEMCEGEPEDAATVIAFLLSDAGAWITGQVLEVSGGERL